MSSGFGSSANVCPTDQATLLQAVVQKLRTEIAQFATETTCFVSDEPWPSVSVNDNLFCTVCPLSDTFDPNTPVGAGEFGIVEVSEFQVSVWSRIETDQLERATLAFLDDERGLLILKKAVLKCLAGQQLFSDYPTDTLPLLIEYCRPTSAKHPPSRQHTDDFSSFGIVFEAPFYWDLT